MAVGSREMDPNDLKERDLYVDECCSQILSQKEVQHVIVMNENRKLKGRLSLDRLLKSFF